MICRFSSHHLLSRITRIEIRGPLSARSSVIPLKTLDDPDLNFMSRLFEFIFQVILHMNHALILNDEVKHVDRISLHLDIYEIDQKNHILLTIILTSRSVIIFQRKLV